MDNAKELLQKSMANVEHKLKGQENVKQAAKQLSRFNSIMKQ